MINLRSAGHAEVVDSVFIQLRPASPAAGRGQQSSNALLTPRKTTDTPRRKIDVSERSLTPIPTGFQHVVQYVSRGTQWYSPSGQKTEGSCLDAISLTTQPLGQLKPHKLIVSVPTIVPPPPTKSASRLDGSGSGNNQELDRERTTSASTTITTLPAEYTECATEDLVALIATMIEELIDTNDVLTPRPDSVLTRFHSRTAPNIPVLDYLQRIAKHARLSPPLLLAIVYYIDRLCALYPDFTVTTLTIHRFLITAATVAAKGLSDTFWNNSTYARVGGIRTAELSMLELEFLYRLGWKIIPHPEVLVDYYKGLIKCSTAFELRGDRPPSSEDDDVNEVQGMS